MLTVMLLLAASASAESQTGQAWALAYTGFVFRMCPGWDQRTDVIPLNILPSPDTMETTWGEDGVMTKAYRAGGRAAEAASRADPEFCEHPTRSQPERAALLERVLVRVPSLR